MFSRIAALSVPVLLAGGLIATEFANGNAGSPATLLRPMAFAMAGAALVEAVALLVFRRVTAAVGASTLIVFVLLGGDRIMAVALWALLFWAVLSALWWVRHRRLAPAYHAAFVPIAAIAFGLSLAQVLTSGALVLASPPERTDETPSGPNIYVLILDAYARQDTLAAYGLDNDPFLGALEDRGFDVYRDSRSNYNYTATALASMLNMKPASELPGIPNAEVSWQAQSGALLRSINQAEAIEILASHGYRTASIPPVARHAELFAVDRYLDSGSLSDFERHILTDTALAGILEVVAPDWIAAQYRERVTRAFEDFGPQPPGTFLWAHVLMPHFPYLFDADGDPRPLPECLPGCPWTNALGEIEAGDLENGYLPQVEFANRMVLAAVDRIVADDPGAVIVVMGDHGSRYDPSDVDETFRNLLAVRSPGHPQLLGQAPTTVNVISSILNAYLGTDLPRWPDDQFVGSGLGIRRVAPVQ